MDKIEYDFYENPTNGSTYQPSKYHIRICNRQTVDTKELIESISKKCTLTSADILAVITAFNEEISYELSRGKTVKIDGLCRFEISLTTVSGICTGEENGASIGLKGVHVHSDAALAKSVKSQLLPRARSKGVHSTSISEEAVLERLTEHFASHPTINCAGLQNLCSITRYMARRHINRLLGEKKLVNIGYKNHPIYMLNKSIHNNENK
ncbi:MAG: HU family DNA-binding protein [Phocaeicola sp.]